MKLKALLAASTVALAAAVPLSANANPLSFVGGTGGAAGTVLSGNGNVGQNLFTGPGGNVGFSWVDTKDNYLAYSEFTVGVDFKLTFQDYEPEEDLQGTSDERSGFQLFAGSFGGSLTAQIAPDPASAAPCGSDVAAAFGTTDCVLVTGADNEPTDFVTPPVTYGTFAAGTYVLMFSEGNEPNNGSAEFLIQPIPLPAAGWMLLAGLGGMAALRRRQKS